MSILDMLRIIHWRMIGAPEDSAPVPTIEMARQRLAAREKAEKQKANPKTVVDIRAELARRQNGEAPKGKPRKPNPRAQEIRAELARRQAANQAANQ
ncbi:hypothetical protein AXA44_02590 [Rhodococcus sp. SC4]|nr:hypothetical protein AXA44_02590 [Rhodococcus sp. SC4]RYE43647.1 MAG: hypothetical protein EOP24_27360 [Hyphomicrobiales bacterium]